MDLGAEDSFIDERLGRQVGLWLVELAEPKTELDLDGRMFVRVSWPTATVTVPRSP